MHDTGAAERIILHIVDQKTNEPVKYPVAYLGLQGRRIFYGH